MSQTSKVLLAFTGVFVAGAVAGGIVALRIGTEQAKAVEHVGSTEPRPTAVTKPAVTVVTPDIFPLRQLEQFKARLGLTSAQGEEIKPIVTLTGKKLQELSQDNAAATNALLEEMYKQVGFVLTDAQKKSLAEMQKNRQTSFVNRGNNGRRGGPGNPGDNIRPGGSGNTSSFSSLPGSAGPGVPGGPPRTGNRRGGPPGPPSATNSSPQQPPTSSAPAPADQSPAP